MTTLSSDTTATNTATSASDPSASARETYLADLNAREDKLLRIANGIRDEVVFPRLRELSIPEESLHSVAMRWARYIQWSRAYDGPLAWLLGVKRTGINGTVVATPEVR